jgi:uncharacterized membrane protein YqjE
MKPIADALLATVQNRAELFGVELQMEKHRLVEAIVCAAAVAAFGMVALSPVTFAVVILFWENSRLAALAGLSVLYLLGTVLMWRAWQARLKVRSAFACPLDELKMDHASLGVET